LGETGVVLLHWGFKVALWVSDKGKARTTVSGSRSVFPLIHKLEALPDAERVILQALDCLNLSMRNLAYRKKLDARISSWT